MPRSLAKSAARLPLLQGIQTRTEVDVVGLVVEHKGRNRFHTRRLCLGNASLLLTEMHHFKLEPLGVEGGGDVLFSSNATGQPAW